MAIDDVRAAYPDRRVVQAVVLAAGRGTRLGALTAEQPKPMIPICGRPVLEIILAGIAAAGVNRCLIVAGYKADAIHSYFGDGAAWGWRLDYVMQEKPNGTGAALALAADWAGGQAVLASYGDILTDPEHYAGITQHYQQTEAAAVIGINPVDDPYAGAAVLRSGNRITKVIEKPPQGTVPSNWNLAGISVYGPAVWPALNRLRPSSRGEYELTDAITALINDGNLLVAHELRGYWSDIGTPEALHEAEEHFAAPRE